MVLHTFDMNMQSLADKKITICLILILLDLFLDGELSMLSYFVRKKNVHVHCTYCIVNICEDKDHRLLITFLTYSWRVSWLNKNEHRGWILCELCYQLTL